MYTRQEASKIKQEFWTAFGRYMAPVPSFLEEPVNWLNYKTGIKHLFIRKEADARKAYIGLECHHSDPEERSRIFTIISGSKKKLEEDTGMEWQMEEDVILEEGKAVSRISAEITGVNIFQKETWPELIRFFKTSSIALDEVWSILRMNNF